jgi:hypothetical protein
MFGNDIDVIRAVHSDRIKRDIRVRDFDSRDERVSRIARIRRKIGRPIVRIGTRIAGENATEPNLRLAR